MDAVCRDFGVLPEHQMSTRCSGVKATDATLSDESEGVERDRWVFPCEPVHGCLERVVHPGRGRLPRAWRAGHVPNQPVGQGPQTPVMRVTYLWLLCGEVRRFDVFNEFRRGKNQWHGDTPCPRMLPMWHGGCLLRSSQYAGTGAASGEGQSSV